MNILVTGGNGFIGQHLLRELAQTDHTIAVITRQEMLDPGSIKVIAGDLGMFEEMLEKLPEDSVGDSFLQYIS